MSPGEPINYLFGVDRQFLWCIFCPIRTISQKWNYLPASFPIKFEYSLFNLPLGVTKITNKRNADRRY